MATKIQAARLLTYDAAAKKDAGARVDLEVGMAKLFASETCGEVAMEAMRIHGGYGYIKDFDVERYYRDAPLMIIGEGTNEIPAAADSKASVGTVRGVGYRSDRVYTPTPDSRCGNEALLTPR